MREIRTIGDVEEALKAPGLALERAAALRAKAAAVRASLLVRGMAYDADRVQTSPRNWQEEALAEAADVDAEADALEASVAEKRGEAMGLIRLVGDELAQAALANVYLGGMSYRQAAEAMYVSRSSIGRLLEKGKEEILQKYIEEKRGIN